jgi:uncharacterized membrane protein
MQWASSDSISPSVRAATSAAVGAAAGAVSAVVGPWWLGPLVAWDASAALWLFWTWRLVWPLSPVETAAHATRETGSVISLVAVGLVLVRAGHESGLDRGLLVGVCVLSIVLAWSTVHTVYALRYASLYYDGDRREVDFNEPSAPSYPDFAYLALTIGMTFQVSDTDLKSTAFRRLALRHALLSYLFGVLIIAATINLIAGLGH